MSPEVLVQVLKAASSAIDFLAVHPYPVYGWDYLDYVNGHSANLQVRFPPCANSCVQLTLFLPVVEIGTLLRLLSGGSHRRRHCHPAVCSPAGQGAHPHCCHRDGSGGLE